MKNWIKICGFMAIFFLSVLFCTAQVSKNILFENDTRGVHNQLAGTSMPNGEVFTMTSRQLLHITPNYYTQHFGFLCKKELAIEKATKIPFRFRLGSMEQCNYLEGRK
jgi:hypothetical protein